MNIAHELLIGFPRALHDAGLVLDPSRTINFLAAVARADMRRPNDLKNVGRATLTSSPADLPVFDAVFKAWFALETAVLADADEMGQDEAWRPSPKTMMRHQPEFTPGDAAGDLPSPDELIARKTFQRSGCADAAALGAIRSLPLPRIETRQWRPANSGSRIDLARTTASARKTFGETLRLSHLARPSKPRKLLLLIDVSGSMKIHSEAYLRAAHALTQRGSAVETFCFSTRLTRATAALRHRHADEALARLSAVVLGFDGGTRIGGSLEEFLGVSRYAALVRGAITIILSDGLECGSTSAITRAVERLARLSHRLIWLTPLARDPRYLPVTRAMAAILPHLDCLAEASDLASLHRGLSRLKRAGREPRAQAARSWHENRRTP